MKSPFICPICSHPLTEESGRLLCTNLELKKKHSFDVAASGYVNFHFPSSRISGDPKEMVKARTEFLQASYYEPIANSIRQAVRDFAPANPTLLDAGCGEGYYTNGFADVTETAVGIDISKEAILAASKYAKRNDISNVRYAVAGIFDTPFADKTFDVVTNIFAPCAEQEFYRIIKDGGILICVCAGESHLMGLKKALYETTYENKERADLPKTFELIEKRNVKYEIEINSKEHIYDLFTMTPYFYRTSKDAAQRLYSLNRLKTSVETDIYIYRKNETK